MVIVNACSYVYVCVLCYPETHISLCYVLLFQDDLT